MSDGQLGRIAREIPGTLSSHHDLMMMMMMMIIFFPKLLNIELVAKEIICGRAKTNTPHIYVGCTCFVL